MARHPCALVEDCHHLGTEAPLERLRDQGGGHGGGVACDVHMVVEVDTPQCPLGLRRGLGGQCSESGTVKGLAHALACPRQWRAGPLVEGPQHVGKRGGPLQEGAAGVGAEAREPPPFHHRHAARDCGGIPGTGGTGRDDRDARVLRERGSGPRARGLLAMGPAPGGLERIRDAALGHPTQCRQGADRGPDPVGQTLAPGRCGPGRVGGAQDGEAERGCADVPREGMDDRQRLARLVDTERLACSVVLPHDQRERASPLTRGFTALAVLEAIGGERLVCLPHQDQGDTLAFALPVPGNPGRGGTSRHGGVGGRGTQASFQRRRIERVREGPGAPRSRGAPYVLGDGGSADPYAVRHGAVTQTTGPCEPSDCADVAHR